jgi:hypothetical protein
VRGGAGRTAARGQGYSSHNRRRKCSLHLGPPLVARGRRLRGHISGDLAAGPVHLFHGLRARSLLSYALPW